MNPGSDKNLHFTRGSGFGKTYMFTQGHPRRKSVYIFSNKDKKERFHIDESRPPLFLHRFQRKHHTPCSSIASAEKEEVILNRSEGKKRLVSTLQIVVLKLGEREKEREKSIVGI